MKTKQLESYTYSKRFRGKIYVKEGIFPTEALARRRATELQKRKLNARIVKMDRPPGYGVYARKKD